MLLTHPATHAATDAAPTPETRHRPDLEGRVLIDLSATGVAASTQAEAFDHNPQKTDLAHVARIANAAYEAGTDLVLLGPDFRLASGRKHTTDAWLDPAVAVRRLGASAVRAGVVPALAVASADVSAAASLAGVARSSGWAALDVRAAIDPFGVHDADEVTARLLPAVADGLGERDAQRPALIAHATSIAQAQVAGAHADVLRAHGSDPQAVAALRTAARAAAVEAGRSADAVRVVADVRVVLSADADAARERVLLLDALAEPSPHVALDAIGGVAEVGEQLAAWVRDGVCDGVVLVPGSLQADTTAVLRGLLPALTRITEVVGA